MLVREYRIPFPCTTDEYNVGMQYMIDRTTREENEKSKQIICVSHERYGDNEMNLPPGTYTEKEIHIREFMPSLLKIFVPAQASVLIEKSWNSFPHRCVTVYESPWLGKNFNISVESTYVNNERGMLPNALSLSDDDLACREVVTLDIACDDGSEDQCHDFESTVTKRPRLGHGGAWIRSHDPIMCAYKVVRVDIDTNLIPRRHIEQWSSLGFRNCFLRYNRKVLRWIDSWWVKPEHFEIGTDSLVSRAIPCAASVTENRRSAFRMEPLRSIGLCEKIQCAREKYDDAFELAYETNPFTT